MKDKIHFKLSHGEVTRRFALARTEEDLLSALKARVLKITGTDNEDVSLFWKDETSLIVLECVDDLHAAIDYAETQNKLGCVVLETGEPEKRGEQAKAGAMEVTESESTASFNGISFFCDLCDSYLASSNGGRFMCTICDNYDLCAQCLLKGEHSNHAFVRLLNGETELPLSNNDKGVLSMFTKDVPSCTPTLTVVRSPSNTSNINKIPTDPAKSWFANELANSALIKDFFNAIDEQHKRENDEFLKNIEEEARKRMEETVQYSRNDMDNIMNEMKTGKPNEDKKENHDMINLKEDMMLLCLNSSLDKPTSNSDDLNFVQELLKKSEELVDLLAIDDGLHPANPAAELPVTVGAFATVTVEQSPAEKPQEVTAALQQTEPQVQQYYIPPTKQPMQLEPLQQRPAAEWIQCPLQQPQAPLQLQSQLQQLPLLPPLPQQLQYPQVLQQPQWKPEPHVHHYPTYFPSQLHPTQQPLQHPLPTHVPQQLQYQPSFSPYMAQPQQYPTNSLLPPNNTVPHEVSQDHLSTVPPPPYLASFSSAPSQVYGSTGFHLPMQPQFTTYQPQPVHHHDGRVHKRHEKERRWNEEYKGREERDGRDGFGRDRCELRNRYVDYSKRDTSERSGDFGARHDATHGFGGRRDGDFGGLLVRHDFGSERGFEEGIYAFGGPDFGDERRFGNDYANRDAGERKDFEAGFESGEDRDTYERDSNVRWDRDQRRGGHCRLPRDHFLRPHHKHQMRDEVGSNRAEYGDYYTGEEQRRSARRHGDRVRRSAFMPWEERALMNSGERRRGDYEDVIDEDEMPEASKKTKEGGVSCSMRGVKKYGRMTVEERNAAYMKASQMPAHMTLLMIEEIEGLDVEEIAAQLDEYINMVVMNTEYLKEHPVMFVDDQCYDDYLIGNVAIDLEKHLRRLRDIVKKEAAHFNTSHFDKAFDLLRDALNENGTFNELYADTARKLRSILFTMDYQGGPSNEWDCQNDPLVGFMEADRMRDCEAPPRVPSACPEREGLFAPRPRGCINNRFTIHKLPNQFPN